MPEITLGITGLKNPIGDPQPNLKRSLIVGPLRVAIHVVQNRRVGEQKSHWDKTNKENYYLKLCMSFVCLVPVRILLSSVPVLYHVNG